MSGPNSFFSYFSLFWVLRLFFFFVFILVSTGLGFFWGGRVVRGMKSVSQVQSVNQSVNQSAGHSVNWSNLLAAGR